SSSTAAGSVPMLSYGVAPVVARHGRRLSSSFNGVNFHHSVPPYCVAPGAGPPSRAQPRQEFAQLSRILHSAGESANAMCLTGPRTAPLYVLTAEGRPNCTNPRRPLTHRGVVDINSTGAIQAA